MTRFSIRSENSLCQRIESSAMQRVAAQQPRDSFGAATKETVFRDSFGSVLGACRCKTARRRQPRTNDQLVSVNCFECERLGDHAHLSAPNKPINSARNWSNGRSFADRLGFNTKSNPVGIAVREVRRISLTRLFTRFLSCAFPSFRGVVKPNRL